ncbi:hypothetical protein hrd7_01780 [Leptolinea sp. HRD-7]|nr:hypothetical protein hrd7_01780 [Leptolinea sp. HRD-7]
MTDRVKSKHSSTIAFFLIVALILLGVFGMFTRWANPADLLNQGTGRVSFSSIVDFPRNYGNSFNNNFFQRDYLIRLEYWTRFNVLRETVFPQVLLGKDGWMYYTNEGNLDYYQRVNPLTDNQTTIIRSNLVQMQRLLANEGITFLFVIAPNKETIYPQFLPDGIARADNPTWADQIVTSLRGSGVNVLDLRPVMLENAKEAPVYFKTDTHWNPVGARAAYDAILMNLQPGFPILKPHPLTDFKQVPEIASGDLAALIHLKGEVNETFMALHALFNKPSRGLKDPPAGQMITVMPDKKLPRAVIFRDSFFNGLQPFTSEHFSRCVYVSGWMVDRNLIAEEKPDIVILEVAERYLNRLVDEAWTE